MGNKKDVTDETLVEHSIHLTVFLNFFFRVICLGNLLSKRRNLGRTLSRCILKEWWETWYDLYSTLQTRRQSTII